MAVAIEFPVAKDRSAVIAYATGFARQRRTCPYGFLHGLLGGGFSAKISFFTPGQAVAASQQQLAPFNGAPPKIVLWSARSKLLPGGTPLHPEI